MFEGGRERNGLLYSKMVVFPDEAFSGFSEVRNVKQMFDET